MSSALLQNGAQAEMAMAWVFNVSQDLYLAINTGFDEAE
jgi:hypothetical protein